MAHATLCLATSGKKYDNNGPYAEAWSFSLQPLHTMGDIQPGVSGVSVFKPVEGVKAAIVKVCSVLAH